MTSRLALDIKHSKAKRHSLARPSVKEQDLMKKQNRDEKQGVHTPLRYCSLSGLLSFADPANEELKAIAGGGRPTTPG
jgi:hypothetical protein